MQQDASASQDFIVSEDVVNPATDDVLLSMLLEPTGTHIMDSGGDMGRHWQINQTRNLPAEPEVTATFYLTGCNTDPAESRSLMAYPQIRLLHFLREHLEFAPDVQKLYEKFAGLPRNADVDSTEVMVEFANNLDRRSRTMELVNSYNYDCDLDQTILYQGFMHKGFRHLILRVHGGCDVRGGYTKPKVFRLKSETGWDPMSLWTVKHTDVVLTWEWDASVRWRPNKNFDVWTPEGLDVQGGLMRSVVSGGIRSPIDPMPYGTFDMEDGRYVFQLVVYSYRAFLVPVSARMQPFDPDKFKSYELHLEARR